MIATASRVECGMRRNFNELHTVCIRGTIVPPTGGDCTHWRTVASSSLSICIEYSSVRSANCIQTCIQVVHPPILNMIIRAVSDSDSDDELQPPVAQAAVTSHRSVFEPQDVVSTSANGTAVQYTWLAACGALILLLLVDLAAIFDPSPDVFALLPMLFYQENMIVRPTASILNQVVGLALVAVWIYSREKSLATNDTSHWLCKTRYGPWTVGVLLCLGHVVSCVYLLFALLESNGDRSKFWLGRKRSKRYGSSRQV